MIESFVDLTYRGLPLGRRVKLAQVRAATGYLELPAPMPVGTTIGITTDEGLAFEGKVVAIHEQVGGSDKPPGMRVAPELGKPEVVSWWGARASDEPEPVEPPRPPPITAVAPAPAPVAPPAVATALAPADAPTVVAPPLDVATPDSKPVASGYVKRRTKQSSAVPPPMSDAELMAAAASLATLPAMPPGATPEPSSPAPEVIEDGNTKRTTVMDAVDPALLEQLMAESRKSGQMAAVAPGDGSGDGRTMMMTAVDLSALGLETGTSGEMAAASGTSGEMAAVSGEIEGEVSGEIDDSTPVDAETSGDKPKAGGSGKKRRAKRR